MATPDRILVVEGPDDAEVVKHLCNHHGLDNRSLFQFKLTEGWPHLRSVLAALPPTGLSTIGAIVDADENPTSRWISLQDALRPHGYKLPTSPLDIGTVTTSSIPGIPPLGIWLMPDNTVGGILEQFLRNLIPPNEPLFAIAERCVAQIPDSERRFKLADVPKAELHTWLAWQEEPGTALGLAIKRRYLDPDGEAAVRLVAWLRRLFEGRP